MPINFVYFTDMHGMARNPSTRLDQYSHTIEEKIEDAFEYGREHNVDFYACGGDFVDSPYTSTRYAKRFGNFMKKMLGDKELFHVWGNHDVVGWNPRTIDDTAFGLATSFIDNFALLKQEPIIREYNGQKIALSGISSYAQLDRTTEERHRSEDYICRWDSDIPLVHIVHGYLSPKPILDDIAHTVVEEIAETNALITLTAHEHTGFSPIQLPNGNWVCNPGAFGRVFASHSEMNRMPQFLHCTIYDASTATILPIQSRVAKLGTEVMNREAIDEKRIREELLKATKGSIREVLEKINIDKVELKTIILRFKDEIAPDVYQEAVRRLEL